MLLDQLCIMYLFTLRCTVYMCVGYFRTSSSINRWPRPTQQTKSVAFFLSVHLSLSFCCGIFLFRTAALAEGTQADWVIANRLGLPMSASGDISLTTFRCSCTPSASPLCLVIVFCRTRLSAFGDRAFPVAAEFPAVGHSAAEHHIVAVVDYFWETSEDATL